MQDFNEKDELNIFKEILDTLPNSIYLKDTEGRYIWLNQTSLEQLKYKHLISDSIIGKTDVEVFPPEDAESYAKNDKTVLEKREGISVEEEVLLPNGKKLTQPSFKEPLCYSNRLIGVLGYTIDITEIREKEIALEKERERAEIANQVKSEFLRNMRHDLRTPFSGILGASELLEAKETDPDKKESLGYIVESSQTLLNHLNEILEFIEMESGQFPILEKEFDLRAVLDNVAKMMSPSAKRKPLDFVVTLDKDVPTDLIGDAVRTQRILINLITNAIKFTDQGKVLVHVENICQHEPYGKIILRFTAEDTGVGIPEDKQDMIFERFNRLTASYSGIYPGKGLGLRMVKQFLDEIDGQLHLDSVPGKGTKFNLLIPYKMSLFPEANKKENHKSNQQDTIINILAGQPVLEPKPLNTHATKTAYPKQSLQKSFASHILIVEDSPIAGNMAKLILADLGCTTDIAADGKTALKLIQSKTYDLVFMDIGLPDMDGYTVTESIRANQQPTIAEIPIVALTAHNDSENKHRCLKASMNAVFTKPLTRTQAQHILNTFIPSVTEIDSRPVKAQANIPVSYEAVININHAKQLLGGNEAVVKDAASTVKCNSE